MKVRHLIVDIRKKKEIVREEDIEPVKQTVKKGVDLRDIRKLIAYAKKQGWI